MNSKLGAIVEILATDGTVVARGISAFSSKEIEQIRGRESAEIEAIFPSRKQREVIHRNDLVLFT